MRGTRILAKLIMGIITRTPIDGQGGPRITPSSSMCMHTKLYCASIERRGTDPCRVETGHSPHWRRKRESSCRHCFRTASLSPSFQPKSGNNGTVHTVDKVTNNPVCTLLNERSFTRKPHTGQKCWNSRLGGVQTQECYRGLQVGCHLQNAK